ncbi:MAG: shikimate dehydrogenase [Candidatus Electronema aureum]|uniref:Shikimate dehydrogenase (NADP(+)) n=1 Tax=Candidatus Electronema aureum TaxID=2005002 RepID=A0A521FZN4_9BACT|nr:MAG: shikimate dehydrogenase [Candidatus Electronema aureum]
MPLVDGSTELFGIIGNPVRHSLSPVMHNAAFTLMGMNRLYVPMEAADIGQAMSGLRALGFKGVSITVPHKEAVIPFLDEIDPVAEKIGAVNTLLLRKEGQRTVVRGFNTDWIGANAALAAAKINLQKSRILVAGAGGAAKAVGFGLVQAGAEVVITNRTTESGKELATWLGCEFVSSEDIAWVSADVFINTTSVGMKPDLNGIVVPSSILPQFSAVMDIVYAPLETRLLREAKAAGCRTIDGLAMLLYQGAEQFRIWTGLTAPELIMRTALEEELRRRAIK